MANPPFGVIDRPGLIHVLRRAHEAYAAYGADPSEENYQLASDAAEAYSRAVENYQVHIGKTAADVTTATTGPGALLTPPAILAAARGVRSRPNPDEAPTIPERRAAAREAGRPFRLGSPTGEQTVRAQTPADRLLEQRRADAALIQQGNYPADVARFGKRSAQAVGRGLLDLRDLMTSDAPTRVNPVTGQAESFNAPADVAASRERMASREAEGPVMGFVRGSVPFIAAAAVPEAVLPAAATAAELGGGPLAKAVSLALQAGRTGAVFGTAGAGLTAAEGGSPRDVGESFLANNAMGVGMAAAPLAAQDLLTAARARAVGRTLAGDPNAFHAEWDRLEAARRASAPVETPTTTLPRDQVVAGEIAGRARGEIGARARDQAVASEIAGAARPEIAARAAAEQAGTGQTVADMIDRRLALSQDVVGGTPEQLAARQAETAKVFQQEQDAIRQRIYAANQAALPEPVRKRYGRMSDADLWQKWKDIRDRRAGMWAIEDNPKYGRPRQGQMNRKMAGIRAADDERMLGEIESVFEARGVHHDALEARLKAEAPVPDEAAFDAYLNRGSIPETAAPVDQLAERRAAAGEQAPDMARPANGDVPDWVTREETDLPPSGTEAGERGAARQDVVRGIAGAGAGAVVGATSDKEHPLRGALVGGLVGLGIGTLAPGMLRDGANERGFARIGRKLKLEKGRPRDIGEALIREYGETPAPEDAGYLLSDGRWVDFSEGGGMGRTADHRAVTNLFDYGKRDPQAGGSGPSRWDAVQTVMDAGHARVSIQGDIVSADISRPLTGAQVRELRGVLAERRGSADLVLDFTVDGEVRSSLSVPSARASDLEPALEELYGRAESFRSGSKADRTLFRSDEQGAANLPVVASLARAGAGAAIGAASDDEHRLRGAIIGGTVGAAAGLGLGGAPERRGGLSVAERAVLERVGDMTPERVGLADRARRLYADVVRRTAPLERAGRQMVPTASTIRQPGEAAMLASGSAARAEEMLAGEGPFRFTEDGNIQRTGTPSLKTILQRVRDLPGGVEAFNAYELAQRTLEVEPRGIKTGIDPAVARQVVANAPAEIREAHAAAVQFRHDVLDYWAAEGGISPAARAAMEQLGEHYVPLNRVFDDAGPGAIGKPGKVAQQVKRLQGSVRRIVNPIASTVDQALRMVSAGDRNRVARVLVEAAEENPAAALGLVEREVPNVRATSEVARRLQAEAAKAQIDLPLNTAEEIATSLGHSGSIAQSGNRITLWRNGKLESWRVAPELARSLDSLGPYQANLFVRLMGFPARMLKSGITLDPIFGLFNTLRDTFDATLQSRYGFRLGADSFRGFFHAIKGTPEYHEWRAGGGGFSNTLRGRRLDTKAAYNVVMPEGKTAAYRIMHPLDALADFARPFEESTRMGEFLRARRAGADVAKATRASQEITTNFQQIGLATQGLAQMTAFLNPAIQSLDRAARVAGVEAAIEARAAGKSGLAAGSTQAARVFARGIGAISMPSLMFWLASRGDQEITDLRRTNAGLIYWFLRAPNGKIIRIPKPFLWGQIFGTGMESALDRMADHDPEAVDRLRSGIAEQVGTNLVPTAAQEVIAQYANKDQFFQTPIVNPDDIGTIEPRYQATERTGPAAQAVSDLISKAGEKIGSPALARSVSPARLEHAVRGLTGRLGGYALQAADRMVGGGSRGALPDMQGADLPIVGRVMARSPSTAVEPVQTFYRDRERVTEVTGTLQRLMKSGDLEAATAYAERHQQELGDEPLFASATTAMSELRAWQRQVLRDPQMSGAEKRAELDRITREVVSAARAINDIRRQAAARTAP